jgi:hypothetical protein
MTQYYRSGEQASNLRLAGKAAHKSCGPQTLDPGRTDLVSEQLPTCGMIVT